MTRRILILFLTVPMVAFALKGGKLAAYEDWIAACEDENGICMAASDPSESPSSQTTPDTTYALWILRNDRKATIDGKIVAYNQPDKNAPTNIELHLNGKKLGTLILGDDAPATITPGNIIKEGNASATLTAEQTATLIAALQQKAPQITIHAGDARPQSIPIKSACDALRATDDLRSTTIQLVTNGEGCTPVQPKPPSTFSSPVVL